MLWSAAGAVLLLLLRSDTTLVAHVRTFPSLQESFLWTAFRRLAEPAALTLTTLVLLFDRRWRVIVPHLLLASLIGFCLAHVGKLTWSRERPFRFAAITADAPDRSWHGASPTWRRRSSFSSFPSGHSTAVFAVAAVLAWFYPRGRALCYLLAAGTAASRVMQNAHWPSDCWAGSLIGWLSAWLSLRTRGLSACLPIGEKIGRKTLASGRRGS